MARAVSQGLTSLIGLCLFSLGPQRTRAIKGDADHSNKNWFRSETFSTKNLTLLGSLMTQVRDVCCMTGRLGRRWVRERSARPGGQHILSGQEGAQLFRRNSRMSKAGSGIIYWWHRNGAFSLRVRQRSLQHRGLTQSHFVFQKTSCWLRATLVFNSELGAPSLDLLLPPSSSWLLPHITKPVSKARHRVLFGLKRPTAGGTSPQKDTAMNEYDDSRKTGSVGPSQMGGSSGQSLCHQRLE